MKSLRASIFLPALVLISLLGFGATGAFAYSGSAGPGDWNVGPVANAKNSPSGLHGVGGSVNLAATLAETGSGPVITKVKVKQITDTSATVTWQTDDRDSDSKVEYGTSPAVESLEFLMHASADATMGVNHAVALADLAPNTEYFFQVSSSDENGSTVDDNGGDFYSFTTAGEEIPGLVDDGTVTRDEDSGRVGRALVGIWTVGDGSVDTAGVDAVTGSGVTLIQQGSGKEISLVIPSDGGEAALDAEGTEAGAVVVKWPGRDDREGTVDDIEDGSKVVVKVEYVDGEPVVREVVVKPDKLSEEDLPTRGVVKTIENGVMTIVTPNGNSRSFEVGDKPGKSGEVHPGDDVTIFHGGSGKAKGLVTAAEVGNRLKGFLDDIEAEHDADEGEEGDEHETAAERSHRRAAHAEKLASLLERLEARQLENLNRAADHSSGKARVDLESARARAEARYERRRANLERLMTKLEARGDAAHRKDADVLRPSRPEVQNDDGTTPGADRPNRPSRGRPDAGSGS